MASMARDGRMRKVREGKATLAELNLALGPLALALRFLKVCLWALVISPFWILITFWYMVYNWCVLDSRFGAHTRSP